MEANRVKSAFIATANSSRETFGSASGPFSALSFPPPEPALGQHATPTAQNRRAAGGFSAGKQRELAQRVMGELGLSGKFIFLDSPNTSALG
jgi:hypothetical protein